MNNENTENKTIETNVNEKKGLNLNTKDMIYAGIFAFAAILFSFIGLWGGFKLGFTITSIFTLIAFTIYLYNKEIKLKVFPSICAVLVVTCSVLFTITSNIGIRFISFFMVILLSVVWFNSLVEKEEEPGDLGIIRMIFRNLFLGSFGNLSDSISGLFSNEFKHNKLLKQILVGVALAIPVLVIVIPLLISSDAAFEGVMAELFDIDFTIIMKLFIGVSLSPFVISFAFAMKKKRVPERATYNIKGIDNAILITFFSVLSVCYFLYLVSQLAYFFSAFSFMLPADYEFTVAEYARRGFFEMSIIAAINLALIFVMMLLSVKKEEKICVALKVLGTFIGGFTLVIIGTALSKMILYINSFGMTQLRITTSAFMIFLSIVFVCIIVRLYMAKVPVVKVALVTASVILSILGIGNVNHIVADYNYNAYKSGKLEKLDVETIAMQGPEGIPYLVSLLKDKDVDVADSARYYIYEALICEYYYHCEDIVDHVDDNYNITEKKYQGFAKISKPLLIAYEALDELLDKETFVYEKNSFIIEQNQRNKSSWLKD